MSECVFCEKVRDGSAQEYGAGVYRFEPLNPVVPGHMLFVPLEHVSMAQQNPAITGLCFNRAASWAGRMQQGFNLIVNGGRDAGQTVFHLHVHYVPRTQGDGLLLPWGGIA